MLVGTKCIWLIYPSRNMLSLLHSAPTGNREHVATVSPSIRSTLTRLVRTRVQTL